MSKNIMDKNGEVIYEQDSYDSHKIEYLLELLEKEVKHYSGKKIEQIIQGSK